MTTQNVYQLSRASGGAICGLIAGACFAGGDLVLGGIFSVVTLVCVASVFDKVEDEEEATT